VRNRVRLHVSRIRRHTPSCMAKDMFAKHGLQ
jgi:hypothetical protein